MTEPEILIFDDSPEVGNLVLDSLQLAGYRARLYPEASRVLSLVQEIRPRLVILDIMIPGLDGLSSCQLLKADPSLEGLRIMVVSGKTAGEVGDQALSLGADLFAQKPFEMEKLLGQIRQLIGGPAAAPAVEPAGAVSATILGARSEGDTSCVALEVGERLILLDAGSGLRRAGELLKGRKDACLVLSHYHADHLVGLPLLRDNKSLSLSICGPHEPGYPLETLIAKTLGETPAGTKRSLFTLVEGAFTLAPGVTLSALYVNHPSVTVAVRIEAHGKKVIYCPDNEVRPPGPGQMRDMEDKLKAFCYDADLLIHDARFDAGDYPARANRGHSSYATVVDLAIDAGVKQLALFHLDASYDDARLAKIESAAQAHAAGQLTSLNVILAREGLRLPA